MDARGAAPRGFPESQSARLTLRTGARPFVLTATYAVPLITVFFTYFAAGKLGQATSSIRSSNLGPVWPAYGIALAACLAYGARVWPALWVSAFLVAVQGSVSPLAAAGQATGATLGAVTGAFVLRQIPQFDPALSRLRDALGLIVIGAFGSALISSGIGTASLYASGIQPYSGLPSAWLIYWLGDSAGVLLVTPLVFTLPALLRIRPRTRLFELALLLTLLTAACAVVFGDWPLFAIRLHVLAFAVLPFVMWGAINFGVGGAALSVIWIAGLATVLTALGFGPFSSSTTFVNALLLDVLFTVLSISGLALAAVIAERERTEREHERLIREQAAMETRMHLAAIVESSEDAIWSQDLDGFILSWNAAASRIFGFTEAEVIGQPVTLLIPPELRDEDDRTLHRLRSGERVVHRETERMTKKGTRIHISLTVSALRNAAGQLRGVAKIARDVTEQERARDALSAVSRKLIDAQEQERTRIARELHDDIGQRLALLVCELTPRALHTGTEAVRLQKAASQIAADVQTLSHNLHASKLELLGVSRAFKLFCGEFSDQHKVAVAFDAHDVPEEVSPETSLCLYRILQEALHNAAKHSGVRRFDVRLWGTPHDVHLVVRDRGMGFDVEAAKASRGIGLVSMQERLKLVAGDLAIDSAPRLGTTVHACIPRPSSSPASGG
jgi:PAS domain S-box-containing protein